MNDEYQPTIEDQLLNRMAQRVGVLTAQVDMLQLQLEAAQRDLRALQPTTNGEHHPMEDALA